MFDETRFQARVQTSLKGLKTTFGGKPETLEAGLKRAGRRLPSRARKAGAMIVAAQAQAGHPKLQQQLDGKALEKAFDRLDEGIGSVDAGELRKRWWLGMLAAAAFNLLVVFAVFVAVARWRGLL